MDPTDSPVVVFSHCFTCNKDLKAIVRIARRMAGHGVTVLRFDMTGLGGSGGVFAETDFDSNVRDIDAAVTFMNRRVGRVSALMGHSLGGAASLATAAAEHDLANNDLDQEDAVGKSGGRWRPAAVVSLAAPSDTEHLAVLLTRMNPDIEDIGEGTVDIGGRTWTITRSVIRRLRENTLPDRIASVDCPTLLFHSPADQTVAFDHAVRIETLIRSRGGSVSLMTLDRANHLLTGVDDDWIQVADTAAAFVWRHRKKRSD